MRIIAGEARGRKLFAPAGEDTRPTADRIRESLFNIIGSRIRDANVLDLFGGTGAMALEALSRGAAHAVIVDSAKPAIQAIERNAQSVLKEAVAERARVLQADYRSAIGSLNGERFDYVFLDPPYRMADAYADAALRLKRAGALAEGCTLLFERATEQTVPIPEGFVMFDTRRYGITTVEFIREDA